MIQGDLQLVASSGGDWRTAVFSPVAGVPASIPEQCGIATAAGPGGPDS